MLKKATNGVLCRLASSCTGVRFRLRQGFGGQAGGFIPAGWGFVRLRGLVVSVLLGATLLAFGTEVRSAQSAVLKGVRANASPGRTRVILDLTGPVKFVSHALAGSSKKSLPPRIYVDLRATRLGTREREVRTSGAFLRRVRVGQFKPDIVRVVLDMKGAGQHKAFLLRGPHRLVIDVYGQAGAVIGKTRSTKAPAPSSRRPQWRIRKIVLDPGHGGKDPGALGSDGIKEKDIVLSIAKKLARKLQREMGVEVVLTRTRDVFIPLEDRTALANAHEADLFISLHSNASKDHRAGGLETYYLDNTTDEAAIRLAARENSTSRRNITDLQFILSDLVQNSKLADSVTLANHLQSSLVRRTRRRYRGAKDLGVKKGLFYVLVGARMPAVLAELFFVTNRVEGRSLTRQNFQNAIVDGLYEGIAKYNRELLIVNNL